MYSVEQTKELIRKAVERFPDNVNPTIRDGADGSSLHGALYGSCVYTSKDGETHCIIGQIMVDLGIEPPPYMCNFGIASLARERRGGMCGTVFCDYDTAAAGAALRGTFDPEAIEVLRIAQATFDEAATTRGGERWRDTLARLEATNWSKPSWMLACAH